MKFIEVRNNMANRMVIIAKMSTDTTRKDSIDSIMLGPKKEIIQKVTEMIEIMEMVETLTKEKGNMTITSNKEITAAKDTVQIRNMKVKGIWEKNEKYI